MTLVELMVGLAVGLFVSLIAIAIFVSTRTLNVVNASASRMGENVRLAMDLLQDDLRSAGFQGCHGPAADPPLSVLNSAAAAAAGFLDTGSSGLAGYRGTGSAFAPALDATPGAILAGLASAPDPRSDILSVRVPADHLSYGLTMTMASNTAAPQVGAANAGSTLQRGDIALIASCMAGTIFQVTEAFPAATGVLTHAVGGPFSPGNASADLGQRYRGDAAVYRLQTRHYYVAPSAMHPGTNSLWRLTVPGDGVPQEMAAGIDRLNLSWGIDTDGDQSVNRYVAADAVTDWEQVVSARLQILSATTKDGVAQSAQTVDFAGSAVTATDRRLRTVVTEVVTLRSRAP